MWTTIEPRRQTINIDCRGCRQLVERGPERFGYQFEAIHDADGREHVRRVGALLAPRFDESHRPTPL
jgi:hypothetical protein